MKGEGISMEQMGERVIALLLAVEAISVFLLWTLDSFTTAGQDAFAIFLAIDFVAFATQSYIYRSLNADEPFLRVLVVAGCLAIAILFFISFTI